MVVDESVIGSPSQLCASKHLTSLLLFPCCNMCLDPVILLNDPISQQTVLLASIYYYYITTSFLNSNFISHLPVQCCVQFRLTVISQSSLLSHTFSCQTLPKMC